MFAHELFMKQIKKTSIELWQTGCGTLLYNMLYRISILLSIKPFGTLRVRVCFWSVHKVPSNAERCDCDSQIDAATQWSVSFPASRPARYRLASAAYRLSLSSKPHVKRWRENTNESVREHAAYDL
jgi:hypothetical protein